MQQKIIIEELKIFSFNWKAYDYNKSIYFLNFSSSLADDATGNIE